MERAGGGSVASISLTAFFRSGFAVLALLAAGCGPPRDEIRFDLADPRLPDDPARTKFYREPPARMLAAARKALNDRGFRVGESYRTARGTWFVAELKGAAMGVDTSKGVGVVVRGTADGNANLSVVSRTTDDPGTVHVWIANALSDTPR